MDLSNLPKMGPKSLEAFKAAGKRVRRRMLILGLVINFGLLAVLKYTGFAVQTVNGITADWDKDQTYWAFYINGEYAMTGVDATEITEGDSYSFVLTKG